MEDRGITENKDDGASQLDEPGFKKPDIYFLLSSANAHHGKEGCHDILIRARLKSLTQELGLIVFSVLFC